MTFFLLCYVDRLNSLDVRLVTVSNRLVIFLIWKLVNKPTKQKGWEKKKKSKQIQTKNYYHLKNYKVVCCDAK